jgi:membrane protein implicated in regulation of membrane protease activity
MTNKGDKMTSKERLSVSLLKWAPWLSFFIISLPAPIVFMLLYFTAATTEGAAIYVFLSLLSLLFGSITGLIIAILLIFYRRRWMKRLRERMAADGITADELDWFTSELRPADRDGL